MNKLLKKKNLPEKKFSLQKHQRVTLDECFEMFRLIHQVSDSVEAAYTITYDVIHEFAEENVKYIELRTTPREVNATGMTKESYVESVIKAIQDCAKEDLDIKVKLLLAIDRRNGVAVAEETLNLAIKFRQESNGLVVGLDLSGDPSKGDARDYIPIFQRAKQAGLKLALHLAEIPAIDETLEILKIVPPDRIGHGTCLHSEAGGNEELVDYVSKLNIPIEFCLTSNLIGQTVLDVANHQFAFWYEKDHPSVICTDDKGVFNTSLSDEYVIAAKAFSLSQDELVTISLKSIDCIFAGESVKDELRQKIKAFHV